MMAEGLFTPPYPVPHKSKASLFKRFLTGWNSWIHTLFDRSYTMQMGEIRLPRPEVPVALVSFNLGVEAGQLAVLAVVLPLILAARKRPWFADRGVKIISASIAVAGLFWFITRALGLNLG